MAYKGVYTGGHVCTKFILLQVKTHCWVVESSTNPNQDIYVKTGECVKLGNRIISNLV